MTRQDGVSRSPARREQPKVMHGGYSSLALAPQVRGVKRELCKRLGVRYSDLNAAGRETVDLYARTRSKLAAVDDWLTKHPMLSEDGTPAPCMGLYATLLNTASRQLAELRRVLEAMAREDDRFDSALQALAAEGRRTKAGRELDTSSSAGAVDLAEERTPVGLGGSHASPGSAGGALLEGE